MDSRQQLQAQMRADLAKQGTPGTSFKGDPMAKTMADLVTARQLVAIRSITNAQRLDAEAECAAYFCQDIKPVELSRRAATAFIDFLKAKVR